VNATHRLEMRAAAAGLDDVADDDQDHAALACGSPPRLSVTRLRRSERQHNAVGADQTSAPMAGRGIISMLIRRSAIVFAAAGAVGVVLLSRHRLMRVLCTGAALTMTLRQKLDAGPTQRMPVDPRLKFNKRSSKL
jgi:hypothetical protein